MRDGGGVVWRSERGDGVVGGNCDDGGGRW